MARNEEKAQSMLNRFLAGKQEDQAKPKAKRPFLATECVDLIDADKFRHQILREISKKVMEIQNAGLGEHKYTILTYISCHEKCLLHHAVAVSTSLPSS